MESIRSMDETCARDCATCKNTYQTRSKVGMFEVLVLCSVAFVAIDCAEQQVCMKSRQYNCASALREHVMPNLQQWVSSLEGLQGLVGHSQCLCPDTTAIT